VAEASQKNIAYIVMGVCGVGKTQVGKHLAAHLGAAHVEADDYHPVENILAMQQGIPLNDEMRIPWLIGLSQAVEAARQTGDVVVACSALKKSYRDLIRDYVGAVQIIFLTGDRDLIAQRLSERKDHFMPPHMLESQLETLEDPTADEGALCIDVEGSREVVLARVEEAIHASRA